MRRVGAAAGTRAWVPITTAGDRAEMLRKAGRSLGTLPNICVSCRIDNAGWARRGSSGMCASVDVRFCA